jgi:hypothetical protein
MRRLLTSIRDNSLSIVLFGLFVVCMVGQGFASWRLQNEDAAAHGQVLIGFWQSLTTGAFLEGLATNWQAAFLQLASLISLSSYLYQRGAAHSRDPLKPIDERRQRMDEARYSWLYRHSLSLAFWILFLLSFILHIVSGCSAFNEERALTNRPPISIAAFLLSAKFWSSTLQTWQAEYLAIAVFIVASIFLRQENSAESKPVESSDEATG